MQRRFFQEASWLILELSEGQALRGMGEEIPAVHTTHRHVNTHKHASTSILPHTVAIYVSARLTKIQFLLIVRVWLAGSGYFPMRIKTTGTCFSLFYTVISFLLAQQRAPLRLWACACICMFDHSCKNNLPCYCFRVYISQFKSKFPATLLCHCVFPSGDCPASCTGWMFFFHERSPVSAMCSSAQRLPVWSKQPNNYIKVDDKTRIINGKHEQSCISSLLVISPVFQKNTVISIIWQSLSLHNGTFRILILQYLLIFEYQRSLVDIPKEHPAL